MRNRTFVNALILVITFLSINNAAQAQIPLQKGKMNVLTNLKPNNILYRDTLYSGSKSFKSLLYRTNDPEIIRYYQKHQENKIVGQVVGLAGTVATIIGISELTGSNPNRGLGWSLVAGGFVSNLAGGFLLLESKRNLVNAVNLFNMKYNQSSIGIGVGDKQMGLVYKF
jgi:hypothetical protein